MEPILVNSRMKISNSATANEHVNHKDPPKNVSRKKDHKSMPSPLNNTLGR